MTQYNGSYVERSHLFKREACVYKQKHFHINRVNNLYLLNWQMLLSEASYIVFWQCYLTGICVLFYKVANQTKMYTRKNK